jgi:hypothetical protein
MENNLDHNKLKYLKYKNKYIQLKHEMIGGVEPFPNYKKIILKFDTIEFDNIKQTLRNTSFTNNSSYKDITYKNYERIDDTTYNFYLGPNNYIKFNDFIDNLRRNNYILDKYLTYGQLKNNDIIIINKKVERELPLQQQQQQQQQQQSFFDEPTQKQVKISELEHSGFNNLMKQANSQPSYLLYVCDYYKTKIGYQGKTDGHNITLEIPTIFDSGNNGSTLIKNNVVNRLNLQKFTTTINLQQAENWNYYASRINNQIIPIDSMTHVPQQISIEQFQRDYLDANLELIKTNIGLEIVREIRRSPKFRDLTIQNIELRHIYMFFYLPISIGVGNAISIYTKSVLLPFTMIDLKSEPNKFFIEASVVPDIEPFEVLFSVKDMTKLRINFGIIFSKLMNDDNTQYLAPISLARHIPQPGLQRHYSYSEDKQHTVIKDEFGNVIDSENFASEEEQEYVFKILYDKIIQQQNPISKEEFIKIMSSLDLSSFQNAKLLSVLN